MAEPSRPPTLPSTADEVAYAPVSWLAVGSVAVAGLFVLLLVFFGLDAFRGKKSLIMPELLLFAGVAVVLSFAARRVIRTSEGTRTGEKLTNVAWWTAVVVGITYGAYWLAIEYAIRRDARDEVQKWVGVVLQNETAQGFHRTLEPGRRAKIAPNDEAKLVAEFREPFLAFRQYDLIRLVSRNDDVKFEPGGLRDWATRGKIVECVYTGTIKCAEGTFPIHVPLKGTEGVSGAEAGGRQWQINAGANGFIQLEKLSMTRYGWYIDLLQTYGGSYGKQFIAVSSASPGSAPYAYHAFINPKGVGGWGRFLAMSVPQPEIARWLADAIPQTPEYRKFINDQFFRLPTGSEPTTQQKATFVKNWSAHGIVLAGSRLKNSPEKFDHLTLVRDAQKQITKIEVRIPVELPMPRTDSDMAAARGKLVVECTDPEALKLANELRTAADPNQPLLAPPEEYRKLQFKWRVTRLETDLYPVQVQRQEAGGQPGMPGMPG